MNISERGGERNGKYSIYHLSELFKTLEQKPSKIELYLIEKNIKGAKIEELNTNEGKFKYYLS
jgi:hypothetical protein